MSHYQPIKQAERIQLADALRGFALLGIILANLPIGASLESSNYFLIDSSSANSTLETIKHILINTKFITIFSILFGFGFYIQLQRAAEKGIHFRKYFFLRMLLLFAIGCIHAYVFWFGDIIRYYAICGMFLLLFHHISTKKLLIWSLVFIIVITALVFILNGMLGLPSYSYDYSLAHLIYTVKSYRQYVIYNFTIDPLINFIHDSPLTFVSCFGKILFGYWLGRIQFFSNPLRFRSMISKWFIWGLIAGILGSIGFWAISSGKLELSIELMWMPFLITAGLFMHSLFYIATFVKLYKTSLGKQMLLIFAPIGKMALSNYLLQTIFYLLFFFNWTNAFQLSGNYSVSEIYIISILFFFFQVLLSFFWMQHFKQGPVEYIWKKLSYRIAGINQGSARGV